MGILDNTDIEMETDDGSPVKQPEKKYFIDTNSIRVPRKGMEIMSFLKDGMSK